MSECEWLLTMNVNDYFLMILQLILVSDGRKFVSDKC